MSKDLGFHLIPWQFGVRWILGIDHQSGVAYWKKNGCLKNDSQKGMFGR